MKLHRAGDSFPAFLLNLQQGCDMTNGDQGVPCKDCTAHSGQAGGASNTKQELDCLRKRFDEIENSKEESHSDLHERINEIMKSKTSVRLFMWVVGGILGAMIIISSFLWDGIKTAEAADCDFRKEIGDRMTEISIDIGVIKEIAEKE